jgi:hypothetical protein
MIMSRKEHGLQLDPARCRRGLRQLNLRQSGQSACLGEIATELLADCLLLAPQGADLYRCRHGREGWPQGARRRVSIDAAAKSPRYPSAEAARASRLARTF